MKIFQLPIDVLTERLCAFRPLPQDITVQEVLDNFKMVFHDPNDDKYPISMAYYIFNVAHPVGYKGRSMSIGDVMELHGQYYVCDESNWRLIK